MSLSQIIVGIDFGTTHSGVSWAIKTSSGNCKIRVINDWPNPRAQNATSDKVPTSLSYQNGVPNNWGYQTVVGEKTFKWFKILLEPDHKYKSEVDHVKTSSRLLEGVGKTAEQVAGDYLSLLWKYTKDDIARYQGDDWEEIYSLKVVLTVPAIWSAVAKERTLRAAKAAGLPDNILLVTEPEAAALAVLHAKATEHELEVGDTFIVCDAGGGTVDLISYKVNKLHPLEIEESAIGDGDMCGSIYLDLAFEKYIITIVGETQYKSLKAKSKDKMMAGFEYNVKRSFTGVDGLHSVDLKGVKDDENMGIDDDTIKLKVSMLKTIFDHVCNQVQNLVEKQIDSCMEKSGKVKAVLLVGGFGSSKYLHNHLAASQQSSGVRVLQSKDAWSAICRGATEWGLEHVDAIVTNPLRTNSTVVSRLSRYSYGVSMAPLYDPTVHALSDRYLDQAEGTWRADNQIAWLLKRGDEMKDGEELCVLLYKPVRIGFFSSGHHSFEQCLLICADEIAPLRRGHTVFEFCSLRYSITCSELRHETSYKSPFNKRKYRDATFKLMMKLGGAKIDFKVYYRGNLAARCEAAYLEGA